MNKPGSLAEWFGDRPVEDEQEEVIIPREGAEEALFSWQEQCLQFGANWIRHNCTGGMLIRAAGTGLIIGALTKSGVEIGFPVGTAAVCLAVGIEPLIKRVRGAKKNSDAKGVGIITRH